MFLANPISPGHGKEGSLDFGPCTTGSTDLAIATESPTCRPTVRDGRDLAQSSSRAGTRIVAPQVHDIHTACRHMGPTSERRPWTGVEEEPRATSSAWARGAP